MELAGAISSFLMHVKVEKGLAPNTARSVPARFVEVRGCLRRNGSWNWRRFRATRSVDFLAGLYRQRLESKTVARHVVTLRNFFRYVHMQEWIAEDPAANLESPKIRRSLPGYLRLEDVEKLLQQPDAEHGAGTARPSDAGSTVFDRPARVRTDWIEGERSGYKGGLRAMHRQRR